MTQYNRIMLGKAGCFLEDCLKGNYIGVDFDIKEDLSSNLPDDWKQFNKKYVPIWKALHPDKGNVSAGLSCGFLWTACKGLKKSAVVLSPNGNNEYHIGQIESDYYYAPDENLPHRRHVHWLDKKISKSDFSESLKRSISSIGTCCDLSQYSSELENLIHQDNGPKIITTDQDIEDPSEFALESHLEDFIVKNWDNLDIAKNYRIFQENGEFVGQQYETPVGRIDILAESLDKKTLLVIELKRGRTSDVVIGQILRYMGCVQEMTENHPAVKGMIIGLNADDKLKYALKMTSNIDFFRYQIDFKLIKES